jgi:hypothetical protein
MRAASATLAVLVLSGVAVADRYAGPGACAATTCHGSATPRPDSHTSLQNEYVTWSRADRHARAFAVLRTERALRIARLVGMADGNATPATWLARAPRRERCLDCHTLAAAGEPRLDAADGVSCEACHGPAGDWLAAHTEPGVDPGALVPRGMIDTRDPAHAAETCLGCHLGTATRRVDHELLAAGHPTLAFELDTFAVSLPAHWTEHDGNRRWFRGSAWAVGQAVALREGMRLVARELAAPDGPDFSIYECSACHHDVGSGAWRRETIETRRSDGNPTLDLARFALTGALARALDAHDAAALDAALERLARPTGDAPPAAAARDVATVADRLVERARRTPFDCTRARTLFRDVAAHAERLAYGGFAGAQQTAWALDALAVACTGDADTPERERVGRLFGDLTSQAGYDPARFARALQGIR